MSFALSYIALTFTLTLPFLLLGRTGGELAPGAPISALAALCPGIAALILIGKGGLARLVRALIQKPGAVWLTVALILPALVMAASYGVARASGAELPLPAIGVAEFALLIAGTVVLATTEEVGWSFALLPALAPRLGTLAAALVIGLVWAVWHVPALLQAGREAGWILWWGLGTVSARIILVWLYLASGRALSAPILYHAMINITWQVYPVRGSFYDPRVTSMLTALVALVLLTVTRGQLRRAGRPRAS